MYFSPEQVAKSFKRLSPSSNEGKIHKERTSGLMYFLALDAVCKTDGILSLDLDPNSIQGQNNRRSIELQFAKLVTIDKGPNKLYHVTELGNVEISGKSPEKRISSNFLTVQLTKASRQAASCDYPNRPAPLLVLGGVSKWQIAYHNQWKDNFSKFLVQVKDGSPFTDLAIFISRNTPIPEANSASYIEALSFALKEKFSTDVANFWITRIVAEKILAKEVQGPTSLYLECFYSSNQSSGQRFKNAKSKQIREYIDHLESLLKDSNIDFQPLA